MNSRVSCYSIDQQGFWVRPYECDHAGRIEWTEGPRYLSSAQVEAEMEEERQRQASAPPATQAYQGCATCGGAGIITTWMGLRWHGTPWPIRHWKHRFFNDTPDDWKECGCVVKLKAIAIGLRSFVNYVRTA